MENLQRIFSLYSKVIMLCFLILVRSQDQVCPKAGLRKSHFTTLCISFITCRMGILLLSLSTIPIPPYWSEVRSKIVNLCESVMCITGHNCKYRLHLLSDQIVSYLSQGEFSLINHFLPVSPNFPR